MRGTCVQSLVWEDFTCHGLAKSEPQLLSLFATTTEARAPRGCALQQEAPQQ